MCSNWHGSGPRDERTLSDVLAEMEARPPRDLPPHLRDEPTPAERRRSKVGKTKKAAKRQGRVSSATS
mgnify:CR=1 FL=1